MEAYAVVETGGKQHLVKANDALEIELLDKAEVGKSIELKPVLALSDGTALKVGKPHIDGASVKVSVLKLFRSKKVISFKKKRRKGFKKRKGHRQDLMLVKVESLG